MIALDTSALVAIVADEPERGQFLRAISDASRVCLSAASYLEAHIVVGKKFKSLGTGQLNLLLHEAEIEIVAIDYDLADIARIAYATYGKGNHKANLNFGDCFTYALAKSRQAPLLFKGTDFSETDLLAV